MSKHYVLDRSILSTSLLAKYKGANVYRFMKANLHKESERNVS